MTKYNRQYQHLYSSRWTNAAKAFLKQHPLCKYCGKLKRTEAATIVDHIVPHKGDYKLFWQYKNWQPLCKPCHDGPKQLEESRGYQIGHGIDGMPLGRHPWNEED